MEITAFASEYLRLAGLLVLLMAAFCVALRLLAWRGVAPGVWQAIVFHRRRSVFLVILLLLGAGVVFFLVERNASDRFQDYEHRSLTTRSNLLAGSLLVRPLTSTLQVAPLLTGTHEYTAGEEISIMPQNALVSAFIPVRSGLTYRHRLDVATGDSLIAYAQVRALWLDPALNVLTWNDSPEWRIDAQFNPAGGCYGILCS